MINKFSLDLLNDSTKLHSFFSGEKALQEIEVMQANKPEPYFGRWKIAWVISSFLLAEITSIFCYAIAHFLESFKLYRISRPLEVFSKVIVRDFRYLCGWKENCLIPSVNHNQLFTGDIYRQPSIKKNAALAKEIQGFSKAEIHFYSPKGLCRGGVEWFNYLFANAKKQNCSIEKTLIAVAKQFEKGMPRQAALLHSFPGIEKNLLYTEQLKVKEALCSLEHLFENSKNLEDGAYYLGLPKHAVSYIKEGEKQWIWDPNKGLLQINDFTDFQQALKPYLKGDGKIWFEKNLPISKQENLQTAI